MAEARNGNAPKASSGGYEINADLFCKRLKTFYTNWKENKQAFWGSADAITVAAPPPSEDLRYLKSSALNVWLLGYEFPETIMVFMENQIHFLCSQKKASLLEVLKKPSKTSMGIDIVLHVKGRNDSGSAQMEAICESMSRAGVPVVVGSIVKETPEGKLLEAWDEKLKGSEFQIVDVSGGFSEIFAVKDEAEIISIKKAAFLSASVLKNVVVPRLEVIIDEEKKVTHSGLMEDTEKAILDPQKAKVKLKAENVDICYPPVFQSGGEFDLRPGAVSNDENLYYEATGVIVCSIGSRYNSYCSNVSRTYLIDAEPVQGKAYKVLLKAQEAAINALRPGNPASAAYKAAVEVVQRDGPEFLPHLTKSAGTGIGIEFRESGLSLNARNDKVLRAGMVFNVALGLQNLQLQNGNSKTRNYSLSIADTVVVKDKGPEIATAASSKVYTDVAYSFNDEEEEDKPQPKAEANGVESVISRTTLRSDNQEMTKEEQRRQHQAELARQKNEETARRLATGGIGSGDGHSSSKPSSEMIAYKNVDDIPSARDLMIQVDTKNDAVLVPIYGVMIPFHVATIKSVSSQQDGGNSYIRIIFNVPGTGFNANYMPTTKFPSSIYVKEISFRSKDSRHVNQVVQMIKSHKRSVAMKESEKAERATLVTQEKLQLSKTKPIRLSDLWIRPAFGGRGRKMTGTLESHYNGFRYSTMRAEERVDIMFQNIKRAVIHSMADRVTAASPLPEPVPVKEIEEYAPFWTIKCESYEEANHWVEFVRRKKYIKRRLMIGADHFNRDAKKGLEFLQGTHLLPEKLDHQSVACFFRYTAGLDKNLVGDFLGNHDEFCVKVLHEFAKTFDFQDMNLDTALRLFLETFRLPGEAQKIQRVLEAFSERYYEQSSGILADKDAAFLLSYSLIMLNTDQHNVQVKKKMTEEDFIRNNRHINAGKDLPREYLSELYHAIVKNEIRTIYEQSLFPEMNPSRWIDLIRKSQKTPPYIVCDSRPFLDHDMFAIISGPTIAAISVVFDHAEDEDVFHTCVDGFLAVAKMSACHHLEDVLDDLVVSLCKFTTLLNPAASVEEPLLAFGDDTKARMATVTVFTIANRFGDYIRTGWRNILDCILRLHKLGLLPARVASDAAEDPDLANDSMHGKPLSGTPSISHIPVVGTPRRSSGLMGRFSQLLSLDTDEPRSQPTEQQLAAHQRTVQTIQKCHIDSIFTESKFLQAESLLQLARALIWAAGRPQKGSSSPEDEDTAVFCLELLIAITLNNRDRIMLLWQGVYEHIAGIVQSTVMPCALVEKAVFGLLRICQRLLPYKENLADELLRSLQLILKLDARVADAYCEHITQEVMRLVKANAGHIKSPMGWRTVSSLLSITARHPEASECGFEALSFIMSDGAHLTQANYVLCLDATRAFAESRVGLADRSLRALDLMTESVKCLIRWSKSVSVDWKTVGDSREDTSKSSQEIGEMWLRLAHGLRKVCLEQREEVRNYALLSLQRCLSAADAICLTPSVWLQCFDQVIFTMLDDLLEIAQGHSPKEYRNMEGTLHHAMKFLSKIFLQFLDQLFTLPNFRKLWLGVLSRMEKYMKAKLRGKGSDKLQELIPELLKNMLLILKARGVLMQRSTLGGDSLWELTWLHVKGISPSLQAELFPDLEPEAETETKSDDYSSAAETVGSEVATADSGQNGVNAKKLESEERGGN